MRHSVAISDIHLSEVERTDGLWMRYRQAAFLPDGSIAEMLDALLTRVGDDELLVVLNGDVFDFDAPTVVGGESVIMANHDTSIEPEDHLIIFLSDRRHIEAVERLFQSEP